MYTCPVKYTPVGRQQIIDGAAVLNLPFTFTSAVTDHDASHAAGDMPGPVSDGFSRDGLG
jgi:hypothetical protein